MPEINIADLIEHENSDDIARVVVAFNYKKENCEKVLDLLFQAADLGCSLQVIMPWDLKEDNNEDS